MDHRIPDSGPQERRIVYIRSVPVSDLPEAARAQAPGPEIYAIHDSDGNRLAFVADRKLAFVVARQNEMTPVSVH
jgi:hypothetical protein